MATKDNRRTQMTRTLLKTALIELMQEKPLRQITIKDICQQADLNRTTFYKHYTDPFALLADIEKDIQKKTVAYLQNVKPSADAPGLIEAFLRYIKEQADLFRILLCDPGSEDFRSRFLQNTLDAVRVNIPFSGPADEEPYLLCFLMQGSVCTISEWIQRDFDIDPTRLAALLYQTCSRIAP